MLIIQFLIGCILSSWISCSSFHAWFMFGACNTPRDHRAAAISLYFSYAVDMLTDFASMYSLQNGETANVAASHGPSALSDLEAS